MLYLGQQNISIKSGYVKSQKAQIINLYIKQKPKQKNWKNAVLHH